MDQPSRHALIAGWYRELAGLLTVGDPQSDAAWSPEHAAFALIRVLEGLVPLFEESGDEQRLDALYRLLDTEVVHAAVTWREQRKKDEAAQRREASVERRRTAARLRKGLADSQPSRSMSG